MHFCYLPRGFNVTYCSSSGGGGGGSKYADEELGEDVLLIGC